MTCKLLVQNRQAKVEVVPSAASLVIKALKEPPRDRKKVKNSAPSLSSNTSRSLVDRAAVLARFPPLSWRSAPLAPPRRTALGGAESSALSSAGACFSPCGAFADPSRDPLAVSHSGNVPLEEIYRIARIMRPRSLSKKFEGTVLEILGTAQSVGCTIEGEDPHDIIDKIKEGDIACPEE